MKRSYPGLDVVRFFAAALVMLCHLAFWSWHPPAAPRPNVYTDAFFAIRPIAWAGWVGVPIFYVLSGFVIALSATGKNWSAFLKARALRLYPAAWIISTILAILALKGGRTDPADLWEAYLRSMALWPIGPWVTGVFWTLAVEIMFYLVFALFLARAGSAYRSRLAWTLLCLSLAYYFLRAVDLLTGGHWRAELVYFESPTGSLFLVNKGAYFALGIAFWIIATQGVSRAAIALTTLSWTVAIIALLGETRYYIGLAATPGWYLIVPIALYGGAIAAMIVAIRWQTLIGPGIGKATQAIRGMGLLTYPLYLLHAGAGYAIMSALIQTPPLLSLLAAMTGAIVLAAGVVYLERFPRTLLASVLNVRLRSGRWQSPAQLP